MTTSIATFASLLRDLRTARKLSQRELSRQAGMNENNVGQFESGAREPSYRNLVRLARALNVTLAAFDPDRKFRENS